MTTQDEYAEYSQQRSLQVVKFRASLLREIERHDYDAAAALVHEAYEWYVISARASLALLRWIEQLR